MAKSISIDDLPTAVAKRVRKENKLRKEQMPKEDIRRHAIRCLMSIETLDQCDRRRVLSQAIKLNDV